METKLCVLGAKENIQHMLPTGAVFREACSCISKRHVALSYHGYLFIQKFLFSFRVKESLIQYLNIPLQSK